MALPSKSSFWRSKTIPRTRLKDAQNSIKWFNSKADSEMSDSARPETVFGGKRQQSKRPQVGHMYLYKYWAKHDKTLPTWDQHPLIALVEYRQGGWVGLNFHYLPLNERYQLMKALLTIQTKAKGRERQRLALSYQALKGVASASLYEPALKNYLYSQLRSPFNYIEPEEYRIALTMPVQKWRRGRPY